MKRRSPAVKIALVIALFLGTIVSLFSVAASPSQTGSTYNKAPEGYGAWYAEIQTQPGIQTERWQRPIAELMAELADTPAPADAASHQVLLRVATPQQLNRSSDSLALADWLDAGNTLITIGVAPPAPVSKAKFHSEVASPQGSVVLDTRRRVSRREDVTPLLVDEHGVIAWSERQGQGQSIRVVTPYLAANAYQDASGNFAFLTALITNAVVPVAPAPDTQEVALKPAQSQLQEPAQVQTWLWIDEYLHGHVDAPPPEAADANQTIWGYLRRTPLAIVALQGAIALIILLLALNQRFGRPQTRPEPATNNSQAYIEALAAVLSKAEQQAFVVEVLTPEQQRQLQVQLGLGTALLTEPELIAAWTEQTRQSPQRLTHLLRQTQRKQSWNKAQLVQWLQHWQQLHQSCLNSANVLKSDS
ncbi:MAG: DUF4350 domain-containing protein [Cyanobacteria bacterium P01_G01_bin.54]